MLRKSSSKQYPEIQRLQKSIIVPCSIVQETVTDEDGNTEDVYNYDEVVITDKGQDINSSDFIQNNYKELRREYILGKMPQSEQNEAMVEAYSQNNTKLNALAALKNEAAALFPKG